jgi:hypothetical protein
LRFSSNVDPVSVLPLRGRASPISFGMLPVYGAALTPGEQDYLSIGPQPRLQAAFIASVSSASPMTVRRQNFMIRLHISF